MVCCTLLRLSLVLGVALLAACAQQPGKPLASLQSEVFTANRKADSRFHQGDWVGAAGQYQEALRIARSIEDVDGIAVNAINASIALQRLGKHAEARASLSALLEPSGLRFAEASLAQAALRRAVLDFDQGDPAGAAAWLEKAKTWCGRQGCALEAAIHNLDGLLALGSGRSDAAAASASAALTASSGAADRVEAANALRLRGMVAIRAGESGGALKALGEALAIDRELALPRKIFLDLFHLGRASESGGSLAAALAYYGRALAVSEADGDARAGLEARKRIRLLGERRGEHQGPENREGAD